MDNKIKILLLEDDPNLGTILQEHLRMNQYEVTLCVDGEKGLVAWKEAIYDLFLVDIMMPKLDGFSFVEKIRESDSETPIIFLTARSLKEDRIKGFHIGCDDYITKPFSIEELLLRMEAILKRTGKKKIETVDQYQIGKYAFDVKRQTLTLKKESKKLTTREADLLLLLCQNLNQIVSRETALREIWNDDSYFAGRSMDVFVSKLRKYLKDDPSVEIISLHGKGFRLVVDC